MMEHLRVKVHLKISVLPKASSPLLNSEDMLGIIILAVALVIAHMQGGQSLPHFSAGSKGALWENQCGQSTQSVHVGSPIVTAFGPLDFNPENIFIYIYGAKCLSHDR
jgi:hypothetical protein